MIKISQLLKSEREKQGLSLEEVSLKIKVHTHKLKAIEENRKEELPAKVFIIGLIKSYAKELKLDPQEINQLCKELYKDETPSNDHIHLNSKDELPEFHWFGLFQLPKKTAIVISLLIIFLLLAVIFSVILKTDIHERSHDKDTESYEEPLNDDLTDFEKNSDLSDSEQIKQDKDSLDNTKKLLQSVNEKNRLRETKTKEIKNQIAETNTIPKTDKNKKTFNKEKSEFFKERNPIVNSDNKLIMKALKPVQVEIIWSDGFVQKISLMDQEKKILVFSKPIRIKISDGNAISLAFNKDSEKIPGNSNQPIELSYP